MNGTEVFILFIFLIRDVCSRSVIVIEIVSKEVFPLLERVNCCLCDRTFMVKVSIFTTRILDVRILLTSLFTCAGKSFKPNRDVV